MGELFTEEELDALIAVPTGNGDIKYIRMGDATWPDLEAHLEYLNAKVTAGKATLISYKDTLFREK